VACGDLHTLRGRCSTCSRRAARRASWATSREPEGWASRRSARCGARRSSNAIVAQALIAENLVHCGIAEGYAIIRASLDRGLETLRSGPGFSPFDIVLLDPPYDQAAETMLEALSGADSVLAADGLVVFEHGRRQRPRAVPDASFSRGGSCLETARWRFIRDNLTSENLKPET
jgi:hypothetical protein